MREKMNTQRTYAIINDLLTKQSEKDWIEFKHNNNDAVMIGKKISALANAASLLDQPVAYLLWGIEDDTHKALGTNFEPFIQTQSREPLIFWLTKRLKPNLDFRFETIDYEGHNLVLLTIPATTTSPLEFEQTAYIRIGSATPKLSDHPAKLSSLWTKIQSYVWESGTAAGFQTSDEVLQKLDYVSYFDLTKQPLPDNRKGILEKLQKDAIIMVDVGERWNITNLGAILLAKSLKVFSLSIARKAVRFIQYNGNNRAAKVVNRQEGDKGYASGYQGLLQYIDNLLPRNEHIGQAFREEEPLYPEIAIRELVANALIHQDMTVTGSGPMVEMFSDRLEITNPGKPLIEPRRFIDYPPRSRNERLAALTRRMGICEEQGSGIDKVIAAAEIHRLPPPDFQEKGEAVCVTLFAPRRFANMTPDERVRACYQHAVLSFLSGNKMKNSTLCQRLGIDSKNSSQASVVIKQTLDEGLVKPADTNHPRSGYVPFWA